VITPTTGFHIWDLCVASMGVVLEPPESLPILEETEPSFDGQGPVEGHGSAGTRAMFLQRPFDPVDPEEAAIPGAL